MVLVFTNSEDATADYLCDRLAREGVEMLRLDTDHMLSDATVGYSIGAPVISIKGRKLVPHEVSNVWYRRPEALKSDLLGDSPEGRFAIGEWAEALEGFFSHVPPERWMNHPSANFAASHKMEQLSAASALGFRVPETLVTQDAGELADFFDRCGARVIAKPLSVGYVDRSPNGQDSLIYTNLVRREDLEDVAGLALCPTLFQRYIEKDADYRVTVVDGDVHAVRLVAREEDGSQRCDVRRNNMSDVVNEMAQLPVDVESAVLGLMHCYGLRFGAIDMATTTEGEWIFFEINPNGQCA